MAVSSIKCYNVQYMHNVYNSFLYSVLILLNILDVLFIGRVILMIQLIRESSPELCKIYSITFIIWMKIWSFTLRFVLFMRK